MILTGSEKIMVPVMVSLLLRSSGMLHQSSLFG